VKGRPFRELDDLVLQLKGLVLVRDLRRQRGAEDDELLLYANEIERVRNRLASLVQTQARGEGIAV
jgi:hypothetical protein